jgi:hypothetical protein
MAQLIAFGPFVFQACRTLVALGILDRIGATKQRGLTRAEIVEQTGLTEYGVAVLLDLAVSILVLHRDDEGRYRTGKIGEFLRNDRLTQVNMNFTHDVCYRGLFHLEEAVTTETPAGLKVFGQWTTIYEALSQLPDDVKQSWFAFDHYYSDGAFPAALPLVFRHRPAHLFDIGGNTGKWALQCTAHDPDVQVTILDLPGQLQTARQALQSTPHADRVDYQPVDLLSEGEALPEGADAIWMSQFLDCFSPEQIVSILRRVAAAMGPHTELFILETYIDRQHYPAAEFCLHATSLYFTCMANGNSRMYAADVMKQFVAAAGLTLVEETDGLGVSHTLFRCIRADA